MFSLEYLGEKFPFVSDAFVCNVGLSILCFLSGLIIIPKIAPLFIKAGLSGKDLSKKNKPLLPETMGAVVSIIYLFSLFLFIPFMFYKYLVTQTSGGGSREGGMEMIETGRTLSKFPHSKLSEYLAAILSLESTLVLGVSDDLFDIRWRTKLFLPAFAVIPLLMVYYIDFGVTSVVIPNNLSFLFNGKTTMDLGFLYYAYMASVSIFCPNSINIYAGVNGLEVGQSVIISLLLLTNDSLYLYKYPSTHPAYQSHMFSIYLLLPFLGSSLALLYYNWWPASVFVGDTYCYVAGMVFAVVGILGHFSKTLLLFFLPQIFNFIYSAPQLFKLIPCPRHRLPHFIESSGLLEASTVDFDKKPPSELGIRLMIILEKFKLIKLWKDKDGNIIKASNFTLINLVLVHIGPIREDKLTSILMVLQAISGLVALSLRYKLAAIVFGTDNI